LRLRLHHAVSFLLPRANTSNTLSRCHPRTWCRGCAGLRCRTFGLNRMARSVAQVFLSYAHLDNTKPQGYEMGWVDRLYNALDVELPTHGVGVRW
jgi:hypothetical protein